MSAYLQLQAQLRQHPQVWLVTGVAGFIGSHLLQTLLQLEQTVVGLDNFCTGTRSNLQAVQSLVSPAQWARFRLIKGDIRAPGDCHRACDGVDHVLHQAALGSVQRSLSDPITTNNTNVCGFVNMLVAASEAQAQSFTYATCSSAYGQPADTPVVEARTGRPLHPYAATKQINELYADVFSRSMGMHAIGLRYFNVYGPRQDPNSDHAYPVARWIHALQRRQPVRLHAQEQPLCDLTHVRDAVQANLLAATALPAARDQVYNVASGHSIHLPTLYAQIEQAVNASHAARGTPGVHPPKTRDMAGHTVSADIGKARQLLGYQPTVALDEGLADTAAWYANHAPVRPAAPLHP